MRHLLAIAALFCAAPVAAVTVASQGVFSSTAPSDGFFAPNGRWAFSFDWSAPVEDGARYTLSSYSVTVNGRTLPYDRAEVMFFPEAWGGALGLYLVNGGTTNVFEFYGPQLYSAATGLLSPGLYRTVEGTSIRTRVDRDGEWGDVTHIEFVADALPINVGGVAAVPEPGTWALLIAGFGLVGAAARRRHVAAV